MSTSHHANNTNENRDARISATLAGSSRPAREFVSQLHRLIGRFAATEHRHATRVGIARRKKQPPTNQEG
jgi:hypothetical protein